MATSDYAVCIVGSGPVGLLLAAELGMRGVKTVLLGDAEATSVHPKANTHGARALEYYRRHGITDALRAANPLNGYATDIAYYTRLLGHELFRVPMPSPTDAQAETRAPGTRWPTPEPQLRASQIYLEPLLLKRALSFPQVEVRLGRRVTAFDDANGVVEISHQSTSGETETIRANYLVGCDGGRSFVRQQLAIPLQGEGGLTLEFMGGAMQATFFKAPGLNQRRKYPYAWQNWIILPGLRALLLVIDPQQETFLLHYQLPADGAAPLAFQDVLDRIVGAPTPAEILSAASWRAGLGLVAKTLRQGNCFIAGDAAHLFTPTGGFGLNTGVEDVGNLGWKLAAVCNGWAGTALLDSYDLERRPAGVRNTTYALQLARRNGACPVAADIEDDTPAGIAARARTADYLADWARWEFDTPGLQLGTSYRGSPIVVDDGAPAPADSPTDYVPSGAPGGRLPHIWLPGGGSLFDELGQEFTFISFVADDSENAWSVAANTRGIPLKCLSLPTAGELAHLIAADGVLVRPDGHIAWRGRAVDPGAVLDKAVGRG